MSKERLGGVILLLAFTLQVQGGMTGDPITGILHTFAAGTWQDSTGVVGTGAEFSSTYHAGGATAILTLDIGDSSFTLKYVNNIVPKPENDGSFNLGLDGFEFTDLQQHFASVSFTGSTGGFPNNSITDVSVTDHTIHISMDEPIIPGSTTWTATWKVNFAPKLTIVRSGKNVVVSWPDDVVGYTLQQKTASLSGNWANVNTSVNHITLPATASVQYSRLIKP
jgi:hypothetical protein